MPPLYLFDFFIRFVIYFYYSPLITFSIIYHHHIFFIFLAPTLGLFTTTTFVGTETVRYPNGHIPKSAPPGIVIILAGYALFQC